MRYIKKFENLKSFYKVGDYVCLSGKLSYPYAKVLEISDSKYLLEFFTNGKVRLMELWRTEKGISRLMTPEEIENFEIEKNKLKYNL